jgi:hypothetical protein
MTKVEDCDKDVTVEKVCSRIYGYLFCNQEKECSGYAVFFIKLV